MYEAADLIANCLQFLGIYYVIIDVYPRGFAVVTLLGTLTGAQKVQLRQTFTG